jgi:hypothetical protein
MYSASCLSQACWGCLHLAALQCAGLHLLPLPAVQHERPLSSGGGWLRPGFVCGERVQMQPGVPMQPRPALGLQASASFVCVQAYSGKGVMACDISPVVSAAVSMFELNAFQLVLRAHLLVTLAAGLHIPA